MRLWDMMQEAVMGLEETMTPQLVLAREKDDRQDLLACRDRVFCLCLGFAGNTTDARDLAQETFAKALDHYDRDRPANPQAWIMRIARNTCLDMARRRKARGFHVPVSEWNAVDRDTPERHAGRQEDIAIVRRSIDSLPPRLRDVLVMREYGGLSYEEIGQALRLRTGTVMSRLNRARRAVLKFYHEEHHEKSI
jgi:RNA polymerase sigma-70 factor (ECF subfamily)